jgi:hypothetical protein
VLGASIIGAMIDYRRPASTSETSVNVCQTTRFNNPEDSLSSSADLFEKRN